MRSGETSRSEDCTTLSVAFGQSVEPEAKRNPEEHKQPKVDNRKGRNLTETWDPSGAQSRNRTSDTRIFSPLLYLLSYPSEKREEPYRG